MIVVQSPLRLSFFGGGTDFYDFYSNYGGAVLSTAINKCIYVIVKERFDDLICLNYSRRESVGSIDELHHELAREAMKMTGVDKGVEITTLADIPSGGTGLGSSSAITVGLLQAFYAYKGQGVTAEMLAEQACQIEIDILGRPIGKQDQYISAYGNIRFITFIDDHVNVDKIKLSSANKRRLNDALLLFYTGVTRSSSQILSEQKANINKNIVALSEIKQLAFQAREYILEGAFDDFGEIMHQAWELKRTLASGVTNAEVDGIYQAARRAGAIGGKITGAGGGGFLLLYCPTAKQDAVRSALGKLRELPFQFQEDGSKVIFNYRGTA